MFSNYIKNHCVLWSVFHLVWMHFSNWANVKYGLKEHRYLKWVLYKIVFWSHNLFYQIKTKHWGTLRLYASFGFVNRGGVLELNVLSYAPWLYWYIFVKLYSTILIIKQIILKHSFPWTHLNKFTSDIFGIQEMQYSKARFIYLFYSSKVSYQF